MKGPYLHIQWTLRRRVEELLLHTVRLYTANTPIKKGKYRLASIALSLCRERHTAMPARLRDGRRFVADLTTGMQEGVYFIGEYEPALTRIVSSLIREGDICLDVGANFGWYTTLMAGLVGERGAVHAFEPLPTVFRELERTYALAGSPENVHIYNLALGETGGEVELYLFEGQPTGHASLSKGRSASHTVALSRMVRFDDHAAEHGISHVDLLKVDVEGAELSFLKGAHRLFEQERLPIILMEMALETSRNFGYGPDGLIQYIAHRGDYAFFAVDEIRTRVREIDGFEESDLGANVFCIPRSSDRVQHILSFCKDQ